MILNVKCEECGQENLQETGIEKEFYCPTCNEDYQLTDLEIEVIE